jgi:hypothetical protein
VSVRIRSFRASGLSGLDDGGHRSLIKFGITDVADLRSRSEVDHRGANGADRTASSPPGEDESEDGVG